MTLLFAAVHESAPGRFCCKSLFALVIKILFWLYTRLSSKYVGDLIA
jgi:hypothetical protein